MVYIIANLFWDLTGYWGTGLSWYIDTLGLRNWLTSWGSNSSMAVVSWASLPNTVSSGTSISSGSSISSSSNYSSYSIESCVANLFLLGGALLFGMSFAFGISYG